MPSRRVPEDDVLDLLGRFFGLEREEVARLLRESAEGNSRRLSPPGDNPTPPPGRDRADGDPPSPRTRSPRRNRPQDNPGPPSSPSPSRIQWLDQPTYAGGEEPQKASPSSPAKPSSKEARVEWGGGDAGENELLALVGMEDALEHTPLMAGERIAYCKLDKVGYHLSTWRFLQDQNNGCCCICGKRNTIQMVVLPGKEAPEPQKIKAPSGPLLRPGEKVVLIDEVEQYLNRAVTIEGFVYEVYQTKSTGTYFVRFEPRNIFSDPPFKGFKLVIWPDYQPAFDLAGVNIRSFAKRTIRVRGVIQKHDIWGMELIVHSPQMIELVEDQQKSPEEG